MEIWHDRHFRGEMTELSEQVEHVDQPEVAAIEEAEPVVVEEPIVIINLPILKLIKKDQLEHGVRHRDYAQYRKYCTNRARRFRMFFFLNLENH